MCFESLFLLVFETHNEDTVQVKSTVRAVPLERHCACCEDILFLSFESLFSNSKLMSFGFSFWNSKLIMRQN